MNVALDTNACSDFMRGNLQRSASAHGVGSLRAGTRAAMPTRFRCDGGAHKAVRFHASNPPPGDRTAGEAAAAPHHRPFHTGSRFSAKARNPSIWSSLS